MNKYLSICVLSRPFLNANSRGESDGNGATLQKITDGEETYPVINGYSIKDANRNNLNDITTGPLFRERDYFTGELLFGTGERGETRTTILSDAIQQIQQRFGTDISKYPADMNTYGFMLAKKGEAPTTPEDAETTSEDAEPKTKKTKPKKGDTPRGECSKSRSAFSVSPAIACTPYLGDRGFGKGVKGEADKKGEAEGALFGYERHLSRYSYTSSYNLSSYRNRPNGRVEFEEQLRAQLAGLQIGGSHAANLSTLEPEVIVWHNHAMQGDIQIGLTPQERDLVKHTVSDAPWITKNCPYGITGTLDSRTGQTVPVSETVAKIMAEVWP